VNTNKDEFEAEQPHTMFSVSYLNPTGNVYDVAPDGQRIIITALPQTTSTPLVLVTNWTAELKK
jgi:hypothetical protein